MIRRLSICLALAVFALSASVAASDKAQKCSNIKVDVDLKKPGESKWNNSFYVLALGEKGEGWKIEQPSAMAGDDLSLPKGSKLRFNFNDGNNHPVNVTASHGGGKAVSVSEGSTGAIVKVELNSPTRENPAAIAFEITGADNPKAKINDCPGGRIYVGVE